MGREALAGVLGEEKGFRPQRAVGREPPGCECLQDGQYLGRHLTGDVWHHCGTFRGGEGGGRAPSAALGALVLRRAAHRHRIAGHSRWSIHRQPSERWGYGISLASGRVVN